MNNSTQTRMNDLICRHRYSEAPTAGALLVCDIPHDRMREFRHGAIEVSTKVRTTHRSLLPALFLDSNDDDQFTKTGSGQT